MEDIDSVNAIEQRHQLFLLEGKAGMLKFVLVTSLTLPFNANAIIGGQPVSKQSPTSKFTVALQMVEHDTSGKTKLYKGSGVLIRPDVILTAAHNFFYLRSVSESEAIFDTNPRWGLGSQGQKRISISHVAIYPGFTQGPLGTHNDLALVFLKASAPRAYRPISVELRSSHYPLANTIGLVLGYGRSTESNDVADSNYQLREIRLPLSNRTLSGEKLWLSNFGGEIAAGDSGGPVLFRNRGGAYSVYGIAIHKRYDDCVASGSCEPQSAFSRLSYFRNWIRKTLKAPVIEEIP